MTPEEYMQNRVNEQIQWMESSSKRNQQKYKQLKLIEIIAAACIPFFVGFQQFSPFFSIFAGFLGVLIVILNGMQQLNKYHENWLSYRGFIEKLRREKFYYESKIRPYDTDESFKVFVENFEQLLQSENKKWQDNLAQNPHPQA